MAQPKKGDRVLAGFRILRTEKDAIAERARKSGLTHSEYVSQLVQRDVVDDDGRPVWAEVRTDGVEELPLAM